jgi:hypothetical protein
MAGFMVFGSNSQLICRFTDRSDLVPADPGNNTTPGSLCMLYGDGCQVGGVLSFRKHHFGHAAPHIPAEIHAGKIPDAVETQTLDSFSCGFGTQFSFFVLVEQILQCSVF